MQGPSMQSIVITIEGPAGSGKTAIANALENYLTVWGGAKVKRFQSGQDGIPPELWAQGEDGVAIIEAQI